MILDSCVQLHESIEICYLVTCYEARLIAGDRSRVILRATGETISEAMTELERLCAPIKSLAELRKMPCC